MIKIIYKYKTVLRFIVVFLGVYLLLTALYASYLNFEFKHYYPDYITYVVAEQSNFIVNLLGYKTVITPSKSLPAIDILISGGQLIHVVEGCNAISVMLLFMAFVMAFYQGLKKTLSYLLIGVIVLYLLNVFRIATLAILIFHYPEYSSFLHGTAFPAIIYGSLLGLWLIWVNTYAIKPKSNA